MHGGGYAMKMTDEDAEILVERLLKDPRGATKIFLWDSTGSASAMERLASGESIVTRVKREIWQNEMEEYFHDLVLRQRKLLSKRA